ncbi:MAG: serpin family protein [Chloroflexota bacterium]
MGVILGLAVTAACLVLGTHPTAIGGRPVYASAPSCAAARVARTGGMPGRLIAANNSLAFALFARMYAGHPNANVFLSPTSISLALEMLYDGARGETRRQMARVLDVQGLSMQQIRLDVARWIRVLQYHRRVPPGVFAMPDAYLQVSNSLWSNRSVVFQPGFMSDLTRYFDARAATLDFASPEAITTINGWVSCSTRGTIPSMIDSLDPAALMYLINAVYFHGQWVDQFQPRDTRPHTFTTAGNQRIAVPMMHESGMYSYIQRRDFQMVSLPYQGQRYSMDVLLPRPGLAVRAFARRLTRGNWGRWVAQLSRTSRRGSIALPRFTFGYSTQLNQTLQSLGMTDAFSRAADFRGICTRFCAVTQVLHKTYLRVNERGTLAAAVTAIAMAGGGYNPGPPFSIVVDRPFIVAIRDDRNGNIPFLGVVNNPVG